jgi:hypothetical protein
MINTPKLFELLRDEGEIADLLAAYGEEVPAGAGEARERLLALVGTLGPTRLLDTFFGFAAGFARMSREIIGFCEAEGVAVAGQVQFQGDGNVLESTALASGWAFTGRAVWSLGAEERAHALTGAITGLVQRLNPEDFISTEREEEETLLGRSLRDDPVLRRVLRRTATRKRDFEAYTEGDYDAVLTAAREVKGAQGSLARAPAAAGIATAFAELETHCGAILDRMSSAEKVRGNRTNPAVATLTDEVQIVAAQAQNLARELDEGTRAAEGFRDFLRTEFWFQRWRVYELWLLVRVLSVLREAGGAPRLHGVDKGVWRLRYGRAHDPVATCSFPEGPLDVYYQWFRQGEEGADMPDLAVVVRDGPALAVFDPKHGYSYTRSKVQEVLERYARSFEADLTAIVNYFPIRSYGFDLAHSAGRRWLLASAVAPGSSHARRLELNLGDVLLARGYGRTPAQAALPAVHPTKLPARAAWLFYWTSTAREVDEPEGAWGAAELGGAVPLPGLQRFLETELGAKEIKDAEAASDGRACVLRTECSLALLTASGLRILSERSRWGTVLRWNPQGSRFLVAAGEDLWLYGRDGTETAAVALPTGDGSAVGWGADGECVLAVEHENNRLVLHVLEGTRWRRETPPQYAYGRTSMIVPVSLSEGTVVRAEGGVRIDARGVHDLSERYADLLSVSPGGSYRLLERQSLHARDGVSLLAFEDSGADETALPLVRFFGKANEFRWSPDASRVAFLSWRRTGVLGRDERLLVARPGDRHALAISLPGQKVSCFAWLSAELLKPYLL